MFGVSRQSQASPDATKKAFRRSVLFGQGQATSLGPWYRPTPRAQLDADPDFLVFDVGAQGFRTVCSLRNLSSFDTCAGNHRLSSSVGQLSSVPLRKLSNRTLFSAHPHPAGLSCVVVPPGRSCSKSVRVMLTVRTPSFELQLSRQLFLFLLPSLCWWLAPSSWRHTARSPKRRSGGAGGAA